MILAHDIGPAPNLPAPLELFVVAAVLVLVALFALMTVWRREPLLESAPDYSPSSPLRVSGGLLSFFGVLGLAIVVGQLVSVFTEVNVEANRATAAPVLVWVVFWLVVPLASAALGNWYTQLNPWRTLSCVAGVGQIERPEVGSRLGVWPATALLLVFGWFQLISPNSTDPVALGAAAGIYSVFLLGVVAALGRETGLAGFDLFTTYNRLISSIAPLGRTDDGRLVWRGWFRTLPVVPRWPGLWGFVSAMVGIVLYDGLSGVDWFIDANSVVSETLLLVGTVVGVGLLLRLAAPSPQRYAHALVPFAVALSFAHYFTLILFEGQQILITASDPFGLGWDLFGTANRQVTYFAISDAVVWYMQLVSVLIGSAAGLVLIHDRALTESAAGANRPRYAMLALMLVLTATGLVVLAG